MIKNATIICKAAFALCLLLYINLFEMTLYTNRIDAILTLIFSLVFFYKSRKNLSLSLLAFFVAYCNYSIVMGEYLIGGSLGVGIYEVKNIVNYGIGIRCLLLFIAIISVFYNGKIVNLSKFKLVPKDNVIIFYSLFLTLIYILVFTVSRGDMTAYSVRISPIYEYSSLLFLFAYYYSGKSKIRVILLTSLIALFVLQDFYYGGRVTSIQLILLFLVTIYIQKLTFKFILFGGFTGMLTQSLVGVYRANYSLDSVNLLSVLTDLKDTYFVFSTPVAAFYASATHVATAQIVDINEKLNILLSFIASIFLGSHDESSNLTAYIFNHYFVNIGGGIIPTYFYFWLGWTGVIIISLILVYLINKSGGMKNDFQKLCFIMIIATVPRWYLYSPLSLFRPLILLSILYVIFSITHKVLLRIPNRSKFELIKKVTAQ